MSPKINKQNGASLGIEAELFLAADKLRGHLGFDSLAYDNHIHAAPAKMPCTAADLLSVWKRR